MNCNGPFINSFTGKKEKKQNERVCIGIPTFSFTKIHRTSSFSQFTVSLPLLPVDNQDTPWIHRPCYWICLDPGHFLNINFWWNVPKRWDRLTEELYPFFFWKRKMVLFDSKLEDPKKSLTFEVPVDTALHHVAGHASKWPKWLREKCHWSCGKMTRAGCFTTYVSSQVLEVA